MQVTYKQVEGKQRDGCSRDSNNCCSCAHADVSHPTHTCPNTRKVLATWRKKKVAMNSGTEKKEKDTQKRCRHSHNGCKEGGYAGSSGG